MLNIENLTNLTININLLEKISILLQKEFRFGEIELIICKNETIQQYNQEYRKKDMPTDVLSFPIEKDMIIGEIEIPLGSIIISADFVKEKAKEFGHSNDDELSLLFIHGMLHLLGFDHEIDNGGMRKKEEEIINKFHLPKSLIIRTEES
ncbi:Metal-dependent hydrolase YbeY, involved in rRNA and/or ribosome maturation and assembly [hydrothermal vent metagenome]|uniref:Metal-dependent hydrolase YbeY, involved in rRNA and/or ribosome maturation and assembly n=1 Tax=hydrothermal vent metagenome TaxID=652676 RepID=A0A1W1CLZ3_9ZZZZ